MENTDFLKKKHGTQYCSNFLNTFFIEYTYSGDQTMEKRTNETKYISLEKPSDKYQEFSS